MSGSYDYLDLALIAPLTYTEHLDYNESQCFKWQELGKLCLLSTLSKRVHQTYVMYGPQTTGP